VSDSIEKEAQREPNANRIARIIKRAERKPRDGAKMSPAAIRAELERIERISNGLNKSIARLKEAIAEN
jgi:hypothetical protein